MTLVDNMRHCTILHERTYIGASSARVRRDNERMVDMASAHEMPFGAELKADGTVRFRLWAPAHETVRVELDGGAESHAMRPCGGGWHELVTTEAHAGTRYRFVLPDGLRVPDPASRQQAEDVHGASVVVAPAAYVWRDGSWVGRPWEEAVIYEMHIGTFTAEGTFHHAIDRLGHLVELGVTAIEIMPVGDFPGRRNWGYDGVLPFAPANAYGRPDDLKALVDAAHAAGLMVLLDVVYNHFGPEGAYIHAIAPQAFTKRHHTPWGAAIDTHVGPIREFFIHNALYWIEEFHFDGLRLDAVHAIVDDAPKPLLNELAERIRGSTPRRHIHLILENENNQASLLIRAGARPQLYTAQWNDDVHHVLHVAATGEAAGYYADYVGDTDRLGRALAEGFAFQGEVMSYRGDARGEPSANLPPAAFVAFIQNHDQVGNRAFGDRLSAIAPAAAVRAVAATYLLLPQVPMLFMGEEWAARQPFLFFCDFGAELADAVRDGRRAEFARFPEFEESCHAAAYSRPDGGRDLPGLQARLGRRRPGAPRSLARLVPSGACHPQGGGRSVARRHRPWRPIRGRRHCGGVRPLVARRRPRTRPCRQPVHGTGRRLSGSGRARPAQRGNDRREWQVWALFGSLVDSWQLEQMTEPATLPRATYRLQFHKAFGFDEAARLAPYLARLGVSHVYASPYLMARPGSTHGYDIVDHDRLNPELGGDAAFARLVTALRKNGLGQIMDFVPNHMGVGGADNPLWLDVLEWGPDSDRAGWFDIDWEPDSRYLHNKLLIPFLGDQYGLELERGCLRLKCDFDDGSFAVWAYDLHKLPICPLHYDRILGTRDPDLERLGDAFAGLPGWRPQIGRRADELKAEMAALVRDKPHVRAAIEAAVARFNGKAGDFDTWQRLHALIQEQYWRIAHFRVAADDINYRRFFNINDLAGLRIELPEVFDHIHRLAFRLLAAGAVDGLRIDHVDGLLDPNGYLHRLRAEAPRQDSIWPSKRYWRATRRCARNGRWQAPPATTSPVR